MIYSEVERTYAVLKREIKRSFESVVGGIVNPYRAILLPCRRNRLIMSLVCHTVGCNCLDGRPHCLFKSTPFALALKKKDTIFERNMGFRQKAEAEPQLSNDSSRKTPHLG